MTEEEIKAAISAVNKFMYFSWNYPIEYSEWETPLGNIVYGYIPVFIKKVEWNCSVGHMVEKWNEICAYANDPYSFVPKFYASLSTSNRVALLEWVEKNFNGDAKLF